MKRPNYSIRSTACLAASALLFPSLAAAQDHDPFRLHGDAPAIDQNNSQLVDAVDAVEFVPQTDILVTELGYYDHSGDGLLHSHPVGIYESASEALLVAVTIDNQDPLDAASSIRYQALLDPLLLKAGVAYSVAGWSNLGPVFDPYRFPYVPQLVTIDPAIKHLAYRHIASSSGLRYPANSGEPNYPEMIGWFGATFRFRFPVDTAVEVARIQYQPETGEIAIAWESQPGVIYQLRTATDLTSVARPNWPIHGDHSGIAATPPLNTLTFPQPADPDRFFVIEARAASTFQRIPAGTFLMGDQSQDALDASQGEAPVHPVDLSDFLLQATEVTLAQWEAVLGDATAAGYDFDNLGSGKGPDHPVHSVSWFDVVKWCNALSEQEGREPCYHSGGEVYRSGQDSGVTCDFSRDGYRLPTEAEWECAARGGQAGKRFPWGELIDHGRANYRSLQPGGVPLSAYDLSETADWHPDYQLGEQPFTSPVGSFAPNAFGLHDMAGNIREWCWDWFADDYYASSPVQDPRGSATGTGAGRVSRGGAWGAPAVGCRNSLRIPYDPITANQVVGFRLARTVIP